MPEALPDEQLDQIVDYWNAANYLTVGQIYLRDNPLLREPLRPEHIKPRLLGHIPTQEALAAAALLREFLPHLRVRLVNVVDLMTLAHSDEHPHGMAPEEFVRLFTPDTDVVVAFHGYQNALHQLLRPPAPGPLPRPRLQRAGDDHHAVRHGRAQRRGPVPPGARGGAPLEARARGRAAADRPLQRAAPTAPPLQGRAPAGHAGGARLDMAGPVTDPDARPAA